jgi:hypothetical protein
MNIPASLLATDINAYSAEGAERKKRFHADGRKFMKELASELGLTGRCDISSNQGGIAVSGEIYLHADHLFVQMSEGISSDGPDLLFRSCKNRQDDTGGRNNFITMKRLAQWPEEQTRFLDRCRELMAQEAIAS